MKKRGRGIGCNQYGVGYGFNLSLIHISEPTRLGGSCCGDHRGRG